MIKIAISDRIYNETVPLDGILKVQLFSHPEIPI